MGENFFRGEESDMSHRLKIRSENVYQDGDFHELEVGIEDQRITRVGKEIGPADKVMDFGKNLVIPGAIDGHVHFRDPGENEKEDFGSGSRAAARGGVTTVVDMPNNDPSIKSVDLLREKEKIAGKKSLVNFALYSGIPEDLSEIPSMAKAGAVGFKYYMAQEDVDLHELSARIDKVGGLLTVHAEDPEELEPEGPPVTAEEYLDSRPAKAELSGVEKLLKHPPERLHVAHVTLADTVNTLRGRGTTEVTPHHLLLSRESVDISDFSAVTNPPIREAGTVKRLQEFFLNREIDLLASDHAPHPRSEKETSDPEAASPGIPGVETLLPLSLTFVRENDFPLSLALDALTEKPAQLFGFKRRGRLKEGYCADITVLDGSETRKIDGDNFFSKAEVTPFQGYEVSFWPVATFVNGRPVYREGEIVSERTGKFLIGGGGLGG